MINQFLKNNKLFSLIALSIVIVIVISTYSVANAMYIILEHTIDITTIFIPHSGFGELTLEHFQNAMDQWNYVLRDWEPLRCSTTQTHNVSGFSSTFDDDKYYICRYNTGANDYLMLVHYRAPNGIILEADINVNMYQRWANSGTNNRYDVWTAFIHEIGHVLGLAHQNEEPSVMKSSIAKNEETRTLYSYDIALCQLLYDY